MNRISTFLLIVAVTISTGLFSQDTLVQWTFPTESAYADGGIIAENLNMFIETAGGTGEIEFKNGATTKAARATGWHEGADQKKWRVDLVTTGYHNLKLSSKISSGGQNPGPRDWKVQYKLDGGWIDVANSEFIVANDWNTGNLNYLILPQECADQSSLKLRWIMTSDTAHDGSIVGENGISKIDDIFVTGEILDDFPEEETVKIVTYPNPANDFLNIESTKELTGQILNYKGQVIDNINIKGNVKLDVSGYNPGLYMLIIKDEKNRSITKKVVINK